MGRYYDGDISGKFMFAIQSSTAADRFGSTYVEPSYVDYYFDEDQLPTINAELNSLQAAFDKVSKFVEKHETYSNKMLQEANISNQELSDYADYRLGKQIKDCIEEHGNCSFTAEL
jgi:hypothetical protein